jgi:hypothetical protein
VVQDRRWGSSKTGGDSGLTAGREWLSNAVRASREKTTTLGIVPGAHGRWVGTWNEGPCSSTDTVSLVSFARVRRSRLSAAFRRRPKGYGGTRRRVRKATPMSHALGVTTDGPKGRRVCGMRRQKKRKDRAWLDTATRFPSSPLRGSPDADARLRRCHTSCEALPVVRTWLPRSAACAPAAPALPTRNRLHCEKSPSGVQPLDRLGSVQRLGELHEVGATVNSVEADPPAALREALRAGNLACPT